MTVESAPECPACGADGRFCCLYSHAPQHGLANLDSEQYAEVQTIVAKVIETAHARLSQGRSSMPIHIDAALVLVGLAASALSPSARPSTLPAGGDL